jgi:hypothetical protein
LRPGAVASTSTGGLTAEALTPGLAYLTIDGAAFFPENPMAAPRSIGIVPGAATTAGNVLIAAVVLPVGAVLKETAVFYIASAAPAPQFGMFKKPVNRTYMPLAPLTTLPVGPGFQSNTLTFSESIDGTATYLADFVGNGITHVICAIRVGYVPPPQAFVPINPVPRVLDTRITGGKLTNNEERVVALGVPGFAKAAVINLTVTETELAGFVAVFAANVAWPGNSSINWSTTGQNLANGVITAIDSNGHVKIRGGVNPTHVVIDVQGYLL